MRQKIEQIEIKEPPFEEFRKKSSCAKKGCFASCGCALTLFIVCLILLKFTAPNRPKELKDIPENFPRDIPIYDQAKIEKITLLKEPRFRKEVETMLFLPKVIVAPIMSFIVKTDDNYWGNFKNFIKKPVLEEKETLTVEWDYLPVEPDFLQEYYLGNLNKNNFAITISKDEGEHRQFSFKKNNLVGLFTIEDDSEKVGTDHLSISIIQKYGN